MILTLRKVESILRCSVLSFIVICLINILSAATAGQTEVEYKGNSIVIEGEPFEISCQITLFDTIKWQKNGRDLRIDSHDDYYEHHRTVDGAVYSWLSVPYARTFHSGRYRCNTLQNIFHSLYVLSASSISAEYDFDIYKVIEFKKTLTLKCNINKDDGADIKLIWTKDNKTLKSGDGIKISDTTLTIDRATDKDAGNYTCQPANKTFADQGALIIVISLPTSNLDTDTIVVEGEKLKLDCSPTGKPNPNITWVVGNVTYSNSSDRVKLMKSMNGVENALLQIDEASMTDRGDFYCIASNAAAAGNYSDASSVTKVRVKDKLAALWPFLGICAEVFVLCAIILIYEKKRNKAELDESDTDNSPEQKNTPDHGKDSVRQRK